MSLHPFGLHCNAYFGILFVSILCTCCSHFFWYCFISFTMFCAPVFSLIHWFFSILNFLQQFVHICIHWVSVFTSRKLVHMWLTFDIHLEVSTCFTYTIKYKQLLINVILIIRLWGKKNILPMGCGRPSPTFSSNLPLVWMTSMKSASLGSSLMSGLSAWKQGCAGSSPVTQTSTLRALILAHCPYKMIMETVQLHWHYLT
jgi:hypothetical protein